jgi:hypothetical protein
MVLILLLIFINKIFWQDRNMEEGKFKIYGFNKEIPAHRLAVYEYDKTWTDFLENTDLNKASLIISNEEIESYNWKKQEIKPTAPGEKKMNDFKEANGYLSHLVFIVTFNHKRIYAGEFLSFMSAMDIKHPVIHYNIKSKEKIWRIFPVHSIGNIEDLPPEIRHRTATEEIKLYFQNISKLR